MTTTSSRYTILLIIAHLLLTVNGTIERQDRYVEVTTTGNITNSTGVLQVENEGGFNDSCIEDILSKWYETVRYDYYQYIDLTSYMFSSRLLYQTLFTLSFDPSSVGRYCQYYKTIRDESDRCPNSPNKAAILNGFALADYLCLERLQDYISTMPCLSEQESVGAFSSCQNCSEYDSAPYIYTNPNEGLSNNETITRMKFDCRYLQCDIDCRHPLIIERCGKVAGAFVLDALARTFMSIWTGFKTDIESRLFWTSFPDECRRLMHVSKNDPTDDYVSYANDNVPVAGRSTIIGAPVTGAVTRAPVINTVAGTHLISPVKGTSVISTAAGGSAIVRTGASMSPARQYATSTEMMSSTRTMKSGSTATVIPLKASTSGISSTHAVAWSLSFAPWIISLGGGVW